MTQKKGRDAQTLLAGFRDKYPAYKEVDDVTLLSAIQKKHPEYRDVSMEVLPNANSLLEKAQPKNPMPFFDKSDIGKVAFQGGQGIFGNLPQNIVENPMMTAMGGIPGVQAKSGAQIPGGIASLLGMKIGSQPETTEFSDKYMNPQSDGGKIAGIGANILGGLVAPTAFAGKGLVKGIQSIRTAPIKREIRGVEELINLSRKSSEPIKQEVSQIKNVENILENRALKTNSGTGETAENLSKSSESLKQGMAKDSERLAYTGEKWIDRAVERKVAKHNKAFGEKFSKLESNMTDEDIASILDTASNDYGASDIAGSPGNKLKALAKKFGPKSEVDELGNEVVSEARLLSPQEVQAVNKQILSLTKDERAKAIYYKHFMENLPEGVPGLKDLKASHAPVYKDVKNAQKLSKSAIKRVATGSASDPEVVDLSRAEKKIGTKILDKAKLSYEENKLKQMMIDQKKDGIEKGTLEAQAKLKKQKLVLQKRMNKAESKLSSKADEQVFLKDKIDSLDRKLDETRSRRALALAAGTLLGGGKILSAFRQVDDSSR